MAEGDQFEWYLQIGGPAANKLESLPSDELLRLALHSLSNIFAMNVKDLAQRLSYHQLVYWGLKATIRGGYCYSNLQSTWAKKILLQPYLNTIFFAGEAVYNDSFEGTVEAALASGKSAAHIIQNNSDQC